MVNPLRIVYNYLVPAIKFMSNIHSPWSHKQTTGEDYYKAWTILKPGYLIFTHTSGELTNVTIPGFWKHCAIYCKAGHDIVDELVVDATRKGVTAHPLASFLLHTDYFVILKCKDLTDEEHEEIASHATEKIGCQYDFQFALNNDSFYCFELAFAAICEQQGKQVFEPSLFLGEAKVDGEDFFKSGKFEVVYRSEKCPT